MSLLDDIRTDLVNESAHLSNTLRKAKILANAIGLPEFREWVDSELSGYVDRGKVPSYRRFRPTNLCQGRWDVGPVGRSKSVPPESSLASVTVRASCSGQVSQRQAGGRQGG